MTSALIVIGLGVLTNMLVDRPAFKESVTKRINAFVTDVKAEYQAFKDKDKKTLIVAEKTETEQKGPQ